MTGVRSSFFGLTAGPARDAGARRRAEDGSGRSGSLFGKGAAPPTRAGRGSMPRSSEASNRMDPAVGTLLNLGDCNERRGRSASALGQLPRRTIRSRSHATSNRADFAKKKGDAIQPEAVVADDRGRPERAWPQEISRDGTEVNDGAWGTPMPVDPGSHTIDAQAPGAPVTLKIGAKGLPPRNGEGRPARRRGRGRPARRHHRARGLRKNDVREVGAALHHRTHHRLLGIGVRGGGGRRRQRPRAPGEGTWNDAARSLRLERRMRCRKALKANQDARDKGQRGDRALRRRPRGRRGGRCVSLLAKPAPPRWPTSVAPGGARLRCATSAKPRLRPWRLPRRRVQQRAPPTSRRAHHSRPTDPSRPRATATTRPTTAGAVQSRDLAAAAA